MPAIVVSIDGVLLDPAQAAISVFDRGLLYGDGCFEVLRTWDGLAVELDAHLDRLLDAARFLRMHGIERRVLEAGVQGALDAAGPGDHRVRIVLTRGPGALGARPEALGPGRTITIVEPLPPPPRELALAVVDWPLPRRRGHGHKTLAYLDHLIARDLAHAAGADEAVRLDEDGDVVEGATCNVFAVDRAGTVHTPALDTGALPGIVRAHVLRVCAELALDVRVGRLALDALREAHEVFVTSSLRGVVAVTRLDGAALPSGALTARIARAYTAAMRARASALGRGRLGRDG